MQCFQLQEAVTHTGIHTRDKLLILQSDWTANILQQNKSRYRLDTRPPAWRRSGLRPTICTGERQ